MKRTKYQEQVAAAVESLGQRHPERRELCAYELGCELRRLAGERVEGARAVNFRALHALGESGVHWECRSACVAVRGAFGRGKTGTRLDVAVVALNPHFIG